MPEHTSGGSCLIAFRSDMSRNCEDESIVTFEDGPPLNYVSNHQPRLPNRRALA